jgi:diguanylate cyclase (GGDEF)-like protein
MQTKLRQQFLNQISSDFDMPGENIAFLILKVCRIKEVNVTYGFATGDNYIAYVEDILKTILRPADVLCRIGDNEFVIMLPALKNAAHVLLAVNKINTEFKRIAEIDGVQILPKVVIGGAIKPDHGETPEELLHAAILAMQQAENNKSDYSIHTISNEEAPSSMVLENEIQHALDHDEFSLFYQPKIDLNNFKICGVEALIRWHSSKFGPVNTQDFINVLETSEYLLRVTRWVLNTAIRESVKLQGIIPDFTVAINFSPSLLTNNDIVDIISDTVKIWSVDPSKIIIEVTEGAMMSDPEKSLLILNELHHTGFDISIDDFGTGYSSLAYLKNLPADELKIDMSFIRNMMNDEKDASIVQAAINLAHTMGLKTVAEGVEDERVAEQLKLMGCDHAQGYHFAKPMSYHDLIQWSKNQEFNE